MNTLGVYISVPFCRSKCTYCNFASGVFSDGYHERYVDLIADGIRRSRESVAHFGAVLPTVADSVYLGGGTPSILAPALLYRLFGTLREEFEISPSAEITLECAPGQLADDVLGAMVECGVNRVSFGVQSFIDREAAATGRLHNRETALRDIARVRRAGIGSVNADLIAGLPHQTAASWRESLGMLVDSEVDHASVYMLEVDEDSRLGRELVEGGKRYHAATVPSDDQTADFYLEAIATLQAAGLGQYEISNFARSGGESLHNKKYWQRQPYLGFGLDAHSMLRTVDGEAVRFQTTDDLQVFLDGTKLAKMEPISRHKSLQEAWFLGLRLTEGVSLRALEVEFGYTDAHRFDPAIAELAADGFVEVSAGQVRLTPIGQMVSNEVFAHFMSESSKSEPALVLID